MLHSHVNLSDVNTDMLSYSAFSGYGTNEKDIDKKKSFLFEAVVNDLTNRQRDCILMYYYDNMKMKDIAKKLSLSPSTVTRHIKAAKVKLKNIAKYF